MKAINQERDMLIYHARKDDKRTFVDIGKEFGITPQRVRDIYRLTDWRLNGLDADHHKDKPLDLSPWQEVVKDPETGYFAVKSKGWGL